MLLGEVIEKRDYYFKCLMDTVLLIKQYSIAYDKYSDKENKDMVEIFFKKFDEYYMEYQKYSLLISRSEASITIPLKNNVEVSIQDARVVKDTMDIRYNCCKDVLNYVLSSNNSVCVDVEKLSETLLSYHGDLLNINTCINNALWSNEV